MVHANHREGRYAHPHRQTRTAPGYRWTLPLHPQPGIHWTDDALRWDSRAPKRALGHPTVAVGVVRDPAPGDWARRALPGTHLWRGVPGLQGAGAPLAVAGATS